MCTKGILLALLVDGRGSKGHCSSRVDKVKLLFHLVANCYSYGCITSLFTMDMFSHITVAHKRCLSAVLLLFLDLSSWEIYWAIQFELFLQTFNICDHIVLRRCGRYTYPSVCMSTEMDIFYTSLPLYQWGDVSSIYFTPSISVWWWTSVNCASLAAKWSRVVLSVPSH